MIAEKIVAGVAGVLIGWAGTSLTLVGRVSALEAGQGRIEQMVQQLVQQGKGAK